jgi:hypothetical protein
MIRAHNPKNLPPRETIVANVSRSDFVTQERASNQQPVRIEPPMLPRARVAAAPPAAPKPAASSELRQDLESRLRNRPAPRNFAQRVAAGVRAVDSGPPEGIGRGEPPAGGVKMR